MKTFQKLAFKPGIDREGTNYAAEGGWWDCDRVRFRNGMPETIGGWSKFSSTQFLGTARKLLNWQTLLGADLLALATSKKLYIENGGGFYDITPIRSSVTLANPITTGTAGASIVTITTAVAHGASAGDYVTVSGATGFDGIATAALNQEFEILTVPSTTTLTVQTNDGCTAGAVTGGGAAVTLAFQISVGSDVSVSGTGWGVGTWGRGAWGSEALVSAGSANQIRLWSLTNYGEDLVMGMRGGAIYYWDATAGLAVRGVELSTLGGASGVPPQVGTVLVTQDRHMIALGATELISGVFDPLLIRWSNQEEVMNWTPASTNTAGDYRLTSGSYIVTGQVTRDEVLVWTDVSLHSMRYSGPPYTFDIRQIGDNVSIAGPNAAVTANNVTYWMGRDKFYMYNGVAQTLPCSVRRYVFNDLDRSQATQIHAGLNEQHSEVWWFYCSQGSVDLDKYVVFNYAENVWYYGTLQRSAWVNASIRGQPYATWGGYLYAHEEGIDDGSTNPPSSLNAFIESTDFDIQDGTSFYFVERLLPDFRFDMSTATTPTAVVTVKARDFPGQAYRSGAADNVTRTVEAPVEQYTEEVWMRLRGRHLALRVASSSDAGTAWQIGMPRISVRTDGRR